MNIFTTLEQSKALKEAGFPQGESNIVYYEDVNPAGYTTWKYAFRVFVDTENWETIDTPSASEIMEEMKNKVIGLAFRYSEVRSEWIVEWRWETIWNADLLSALVEAYIKIKGE